MDKREKKVIRINYWSVERRIEGVGGVGEGGGGWMEGR